jgi:hypothetical protein
MNQVKTKFLYCMVILVFVLSFSTIKYYQETASLQAELRACHNAAKRLQSTQTDVENVAIAMELLTSWQYMDVTNLTTKDYYTYVKPAMNSKSSFVRVKAAGLISRQKGEYMSDALATIIKMLSQKEEYDGMIILSLAVLRIDETKRRQVLDILQAKREEGVITSSQYSKIESEVEDFLKRKNQSKSKSPK